MPTVTADVDFDLDGIDDYDLIDELESRGYDVRDLIDRIEDKGYTVYGKGHKPNITRAFVEELYTTYQTMSPDFFHKELKKFFRKHLNVSEY
jgi:hypothetical protein